MNHVLFLLPLLLVGFVPFAYAETTTGQNYDLVEDHINGIATWTSHPERIMDGTWQNYVLSVDSQKVIFNSNSIGSFIYDIDSCSYSIYENGYDGANIIPSVSSVATYLNGNTWSNMEVNNEICDVQVSQSEDGIFLTSTKILTESFTNGTNVNGTAIVNTIQTQKFVDEIKLDINSGIKETFKVWNTGNESLGISQTIHTGESITIADQTIPIIQYSGQSFDRDFIVDNQAEILQLTDSINYDFDIGIDSLDKVNIIFDGTDSNPYKVNMDYSTNQINFLEIDPTLTTTGSGTFDVTPIWEHTISSGTIDGTTLTGTQITNLQSDLTANNQYHTLSGTTLVVHYTISTTPDPPTNLSAQTGIPIILSYDTPIDDGDDTITGYKIFRTTDEFSLAPLPDNGGSDTQVDFVNNELLVHGDSIIGGADVDEDFSTSSNWLKTGSKVDIDTASQTLNIDSERDGSTHGVSFDFGGVIDDTWVLRFEWDVTQYNNPTSGSDRFYATLSSLDSSNSYTGVTQDTIGFYARSHPSSDAWGTIWSDGTTSVSGSGTNHGASATILPVASLESQGVMYMEMIRTNANTFTLQMFSDNTYQTSVGSKLTQSMGTDNPSLQYIRFHTSTDSSGGANHFKSTVKNVEFYNGVIVASDPSITDSSPNSIPITVNSGTSTTGTIGNAIDNPDLSYSDSNLPSGTNPISVGGWVSHNSATPTNTKLLNINDVTFSVNPTSASVDGITFWTWDSNSAVNTNINAQTVTPSSGHSPGVWDTWVRTNESISTSSGGGLIEWQITNNQLMTGLDSSTTGSDWTSLDYAIYYDGGGIHVTESGNSVNGWGSYLSSGTVTSSDVLGMNIDSSGVVTLLKNGVVFYTSTTTASGTYYMANAFSIASSTTLLNSNSSPIVSATGLSDNTITPHHYSFTKDSSNLWTIYEDGVSVATATDTTSLGSASSTLTTTLDGSLDEFFIDSSLLTASEISDIHSRGVPPTQIGTSTSTSYSDATVSGGNTYWYFTKAVNSIGDSDYSTNTSGLAGTPPNPPTGVSTSINDVNNSPLDVTVSWSSPTNVGSGTLSGFEIYRDTTLVTTTGLVTSYTDTVPNAGTFVYDMKSVSNHGTSILSTSSSVTTPNPPDAPTITLAINDPNGLPFDITSTFTAPANNGGSAITGYNLYSSNDGVIYTSVTTGVNTPYTDTASEGTWWYKAEAVNNVGAGLNSTAVSISTPTYPSPITDLSGSTISDSAIDLSWSVPYNGGSSIVDYDIIRDGTPIATVTTNSYSDTGLVQQTNYIYEVFVRNNVGFSTISNQITQSTHGVPDQVSPFTVTTVAIDQLDLSWSTPNDYNSPITNYIIERESPIGGGFAPLITLGNVNSYSDGSLSTLTEYNYRITAVNNYGNSPTNTASSITLPAPPTNVIATPSSSTTELEITWDSPNLTTGITGYQIQRENGIGNGWNTLGVITGNNYTDTGLTTNVYYNYRMASVTVQGNSAYSGTYSQTTFHLPDGIETLVATSGELIDATLSWIAPNTPYGYITGYQINQTTTGSPDTVIATIPGTSYTATNLDPTINYQWRVSAITIHGTNATGNIANATATSEIVIGAINLSEDVNPISVPIKFDETRNGNSTTLKVIYDGSNDLSCDFDYKFARTNFTHSNLSETSEPDGNVSHTFTFNDSANEIISVYCYDTIDNSTDGKYQINFTVMPIATQINDFQSGLFGIGGGFGAFDLMTLFVIIISMVGFNRKNPAVGVGIMVTFIGAMAYFGIIEAPTVVMGAIALVVVLAIGVVRKK